LVVVLDCSLFASRIARSSLGRRLRQVTQSAFVRQTDGAAAVEFGIVALPFLALMFAIMQTGLAFLASQVLETAVADSARLILTGQAQTQKFDQAAFKNAVCARIVALFDCPNGIYVDVHKYNQFSDITMANPLDANGNFVNNFGYDPGGPGDIIVVRLYYQWPIWVTLNGFNLSNMAGNQRLLTSAAAFRNEPY
jgi:Flp pilus assembly protein TadG